MRVRARACMCTWLKQFLKLRKLVSFLAVLFLNFLFSSVALIFFFLNLLPIDSMHICLDQIINLLILYYDTV